MLRFAEEIKTVHPGIFVHSIYIDEDLDEDRRAGFVRRASDLDRLTLTGCAVRKRERAGAACLGAVGRYS
jgi:hypothetical protein